MNGDAEEIMKRIEHYITARLDERLEHPFNMRHGADEMHAARVERTRHTLIEALRGQAPASARAMSAKTTQS